MSGLHGFIERKRSEHIRALERHAIQGTEPKFRVRLRIRVASKLESHEKSIKFTFLKRRVTIKSRKKGDPLSASNWIVFSASRFSSAEDAAAFGFALQSSLAIVASMKGIAIDVGADNRATTMTSEIVKEAAAKVGGFLLDDVHGVDVYVDLPNTFVMFGEATLSTSMSPSTIIEPLEKMTTRIKNLDLRVVEAAFLMNAASISQHPVAMLTLSVAAVEMLAAGEKWNDAQKEWIKSLRQHVASAEALNEVEKAELGQAVESLFNFGALAKSRRLLSSLELGYLIERWEKLYKDRSKLFHGNSYLSASDIQTLGGEARIVCKEIVDAYLIRYSI